MWINRFLAEKQQQAIEKTAEAEAGKTIPPPAIVEKRMKDSYIEEFLLFKSEPDVREEYLSPDSNIRVGKVLEDLDALAGGLALRAASAAPAGWNSAISIRIDCVPTL